MLKRINFLNSKDKSHKDHMNLKIENQPKHTTKKKSILGLLLKIFLGLFVLFVILLIAAYFLVIRPAINISYGARQLKDKLYLVNKGVKEQNFDEVKTGLQDARDELDNFKATYESNSSFFASFSYLQPYNEDAKRLISILDKTLNLGDLTVNIIEPYASDIGFSSKGKEAKDVNAQQRVVQLIRLMPQFSPKVKEISQKVVEIDTELAQIDASRYPSKLPSIVAKFGIDPDMNIQEQILAMQSISKEVANKSPQFESLFNALPDFMGLNAPKKYLVLMANNSELRSTGGFNTFVTVVQLTEGIPTILSSMDTYFIDEGSRTRSSALVCRNVPAHLSKYLYIQGRGARLYARDATSTDADFNVATDSLLDCFWKKDRTLPQDLNGVIQVTNDLIVDLLRVVGPVKTDEYSVLTDQKTRIKVPITEFNADNVIEELTDIAGGKLAETIGRKDIIKFLAESILQKIFSSEAGNLPNIGKTMLESLSKKDILLRSFDPNVQKAFDDLGYSGRIHQTDETTDFLYVNRSNYGAGKADWTKPTGFVTQTIEKTIKMENGKKIGQVKVTVHNPKRPDWYNVVPCCFYNAYIRVYVPKGSKMLGVTASDGQDAHGAEFVDEIVGKTFFESFTKQLKETDLTITYDYELPDTVNTDAYKVFIQRQPGTSIDKYTIENAGKKEEVLLNSDKLVEF